MLIVMKPHATEKDIEGVNEKIRAMGLQPHAIPGAQRVAIGITGCARMHTCRTTSAVTYNTVCIRAGSDLASAQGA